MPVFIILSRLGNAMSYNTVYVSNNRLFPTKFVSTTYGIVNLLSHIITVAAPLVAEIGDPYPFIIFVINTGLAITASIFIREIPIEDKLKETDDKDIKVHTYNKENSD